MGIVGGIPAMAIKNKRCFCHLQEAIHHQIRPFLPPPPPTDLYDFKNHIGFRDGTMSGTPLDSGVKATVPVIQIAASSLPMFQTYTRSMSPHEWEMTANDNLTFFIIRVMVMTILHWNWEINLFVKLLYFAWSLFRIKRNTICCLKL